jgi:hypothetical protein
VQIADRECGDLGATQAHLQADREDCAIAQPGDSILTRHVEQFSRLRFREGERRAFIAIDCRPLDLTDRVARGVIVPDQVLVSVSRMKRSQAITALWSAWRNSAGVVIASVCMKCWTSSR